MVVAFGHRAGVNESSQRPSFERAVDRPRRGGSLETGFHGRGDRAETRVGTKSEVPSVPFAPKPLGGPVRRPLAVRRIVSATDSKILHPVPLSDDAVKILEALPRERDFVFLGGIAGQPVSKMAMLQVLRRMGHRGDITVHGFRTTFRTWVAEATNFQREVGEMALSHSIGDKVEATYQRGELLTKRKQLMSAWARYAGTPRAEGTVIALHVPR